MFKRRAKTQVRKKKKNRLSWSQLFALICSAVLVGLFFLLLPITKSQWSFFASETKIPERSISPEGEWIQLPPKDKLQGSLFDSGKGFVLSTTLPGEQGAYISGMPPSIFSKVKYWSVSFDGKVQQISPPHYFFQNISDLHPQGDQTDRQSILAYPTGSLLHDGSEKTVHGSSQDDVNQSLISFTYKDKKDFSELWIHSLSDDTEQQIMKQRGEISCPGSVRAWSNEKHLLLFTSSVPWSTDDPSSGSSDTMLCIFDYQNHKEIYRKSLSQFVDAEVSAYLPLNKVMIYSKGNSTVVLDFETRKQVLLNGDKWREDPKINGILVSESSTEDKESVSFYDLKNDTYLSQIEIQKKRGANKNDWDTDIDVISRSKDSGLGLIRIGAYQTRGEEANVCWYMYNFQTGERNKIVCNDAFLDEYKDKFRYPNDFMVVMFEGWL